jgi:hypothetical protein
MRPVPDTGEQEDTVPPVEDTNPGSTDTPGTE